MSASEWVPEGADIAGLRRAATECQGCELWAAATQVVFSAGNPRAPLVLVGEQPGDVEDREGIPFVGPAGKVLQDALGQAGLEVGQVLDHDTPIGMRRILATVHPSSILRGDPAERDSAMAAFVADLRTAGQQIA